MEQEDEITLLENLHIEKKSLLTGWRLLSVHVKRLDNELMKWQEKIFDVVHTNEMIDEIIQTTAKVNEITKKLCLHDTNDNVKVWGNLHSEKNSMLTGRWLLNAYIKKLLCDLKKCNEKMIASDEHVAYVNELIDEIMLITAKVNELHEKLPHHRL